MDIVALDLPRRFAPAVVRQELRTVCGIEGVEAGSERKRLLGKREEGFGLVRRRLVRRLVDGRSVGGGEREALRDKEAQPHLKEGCLKRNSSLAGWNARGR